MQNMKFNLEFRIVWQPNLQPGQTKRIRILVSANRLADYIGEHHAAVIKGKLSTTKAQKLRFKPYRKGIVDAYSK